MKTPTLQETLEQTGLEISKLTSEKELGAYIKRMPLFIANNGLIERLIEKRRLTFKK